MKNTLRNHKTLLTILALCLAGGGWWGAQHRGQTGAATVEPADALAAIPPPMGSGASDMEIARWTAKARENGDDARTWVSLGDALMQKSRETMNLDYLGYAERAYRKAIALNPNKVSALVGMAWVNSGRHEFETSMDWANKAIALDPKSNDAYGLLGDADIEMGNYDAAFRHYQKMLDIRPDLSSYSRGAHLLLLTGKTFRAAWLMRQAVDTGGPYAENTAWCRAQLALIYLSDGNLEAAEQALKAALKKSPNNYYVLAAMGKVKAARKDFPAAIGFYKKAVAVVPQHDAVVALGDLYALTGDRVEAEKQYALVETIHRLQKASGVRGGWQLAQFYADHDRRLPEALTMAQEEYRIRPNVYAADTLAWCLFKNGRYAEAAAVSKKALSRRTPEASFLFHAGLIADKLGDRVAAQNHLYQAVSLNPNFSPVSAPVAYAALKRLSAPSPVAKQAAR